MALLLSIFLSFFFNDTATTEIYTLSLHDALPISGRPGRGAGGQRGVHLLDVGCRRSEEHTSELQSHDNLVCRLLLETKKTTKDLVTRPHTHTAISSRTPNAQNQ